MEISSVFFNLKDKRRETLKILYSDNEDLIAVVSLTGLGQWTIFKHILIESKKENYEYIHREPKNILDETSRNHGVSRTSSR